MELIESLRKDIERLKADRPHVAGAAPAAQAAELTEEPQAPRVGRVLSIAAAPLANRIQAPAPTAKVRTLTPRAKARGRFRISGDYSTGPVRIRRVARSSTRSARARKSQSRKVVLAIEQDRISAIRINDPRMVTATEPRQPRRLEKKKNTTVARY